MESQIPQGLLHLPQAADVLAGLLLIQAIDQGKLPGRGGGGLDLVQVGGVLPQEFPDGRELLCLQPLAVPVLVALEGLTGVQGQQADLLGAAQEIRQIFDPAAVLAPWSVSWRIPMSCREVCLCRSSFFCCLFNGFPPFVILLFQNQKAYSIAEEVQNTGALQPDAQKGIEDGDH